MEGSINSPAQAAEVVAPFTTVHFVLMAVLAVLVVLGILYGMRLKRERRAATRELEDRDHLDRIGGDEPLDDTQAEPTAADFDAKPAEEAYPPETLGTTSKEAGEDTHRPAPATSTDSVPAPTPVPTPEPEMDAGPQPSATQAPVPPAQPPMPLTTIKGLGPRAAAVLEQQGVGSIAALAALSADEAARIDGSLGPLAGRLSRDRWVEQARLLDAGDRTGFEAQFGKLG